jgi:putative transposase
MRPSTTGGPKYGGLEVPEAKRLKRLESENARLKKLLADAHAADLLAKKW